MKIKSFFSHTIEDAMAKARRELGPDAMLVHSRKAAREARHLGEYEVVFADGAPATETGETATAFPQAASFASGDRIAAEVAALKQQLENMRRTLTKTAFASAPWFASKPLASAPLLSESYALLTANEVSPDLAREIVQSAAARAGLQDEFRQPDESRWHAALIEEMCSRCRIEATLGMGETRSRITALVGPPGSGKTATLVKLAVNYGLASRRSVVLLSIDTYRVAAAEQLRSYAAILGVSFQVLETVGGLVQAIEENRAKDLILIDTPGLAFRDLEDHADLARFLSTRNDVDRHLVLSSSMKSVDLSRVIDSYEIFQPQRLLFTKLDETTSLGSVFNEAVRTQKSLSFFATGQRIPEDLETAAHARLIEPILGGFPEEVLSAA
jgi:flagellar biosynthesis protein FlhF